jgi:Zn-dependent protease/predicted transcriptional regulator
VNGTVNFGRVRGVSLRINWSVLLLAALFGYNLGWQTLPRWSAGHSTTAYVVASAVAVLALLPCLLFHEMVHALTARRFGIDVQEIRLWALGGTTQMETPKAPWAMLATAASGPAASLVLGGVAYAVTSALRLAQGSWSLWTATLLWLSAANLVLGVFNLVPVTPLDGGRILQAVIWWRTGDPDRAERASDLGGRGMGVVIVLIGAVLVVNTPNEGAWLLLLGFFIAVTSELERRQAEFGLSVRGATVATAMSSPVQTTSDWLTIHEFAATTGQHNRRSMLPVVDHRGRPTGLAGLYRVVAVPTELRRTVKMGDVALPLQLCQVASPGESLLKVLERLDASQLRVLVVDEGRLVGMVTNHDIVRLIQRGRWPPLRML